MPKPNDLRRLPIRKRTVLAEDGSSSSDRSVFCPSRDASVPTDICSRCPRLHTVDESESSVTCSPVVPSGGPRDDRMDPAEAAARVAVGQLMTRDFIAVTADVGLEKVASFLTDGNVGSVAVVDHRNGIVGIVSKTDVVRFHLERADWTTVGTIMQRGVYCLPEDARLSHAVGAMAIERIAHLPIVDATGAVVGILDGDDVVAWLARQIGYTDVGTSERRHS